MDLSNLKRQIELTLAPLINTELIDIGRAHTVHWFIFRTTSLPNSSSMDEILQSFTIIYALHVQCEWRIRNFDGIIFASDDLYFPAGDDPFKDLETFNWAPQGSNRLDERTSLFLKNINNKNLIVESVEADIVGGLCIRIREGITIDIFPADSIGGEFWRFFKQNSTESHFVVTGKGIEY